MRVIMYVISCGFVKLLRRVIIAIILVDFLKLVFSALSVDTLIVGLIILTGVNF